MQPGNLERDCENVLAPKGSWNLSAASSGCSELQDKTVGDKAKEGMVHAGHCAGCCADFVFSPLQQVLVCPFYKENWSSEGGSKLPEAPQPVKRQTKDLTQVYTTLKLMPCS